MRRSIPRTPIGDSIGEGLRIHGIGNAQERREKVRRIMDLVGLQPYQAPRYPHEFSGGQRQRIGIARALVLEPDLIVCDEPVSALDVSIQAQVLNLLRQLQREMGLTYLFIAHNMGVVEHISDRVAVMYLGRVAEISGREGIYRSPAHPYTRALMSAIPVPDPDGRRRRIILTGDVPSPLNPPSGCTFHPRCWLRTRLDSPERCSTERPELRDIAAAQQVACHFAEETEPAGTPDGARLRSCRRRMPAAGSPGWTSHLSSAEHRSGGEHMWSMWSPSPGSRGGRRRASSWLLLSLALVLPATAAQGSSLDVQQRPLVAAPETIAAGGSDFLCGIRTDLTLSCWGRPEVGLTMPPPGRFAVVAAGRRDACALAIDATMSCWGRWSAGTVPLAQPVVAPAGRFLTLDVADTQACAIRTDQAVVCWGAWQTAGAPPADGPPAGRFTAVAAVHDWHGGCAIRLDGTIACWGPDDVGRGQSPIGHVPGHRVRPPGVLRHPERRQLRRQPGLLGSAAVRHRGAARGSLHGLAMGGDTGCAIGEDRTVTCWGAPIEGSPSGSLAAATSVTVGETIAAAVAATARSASGARPRTGRSGDTAARRRPTGSRPTASCRTDRTSRGQRPAGAARRGAAVSAGAGCPAHHRSGRCARSPRPRGRGPRPRRPRPRASAIGSWASTAPLSVSIPMRSGKWHAAR